MHNPLNHIYYLPRYREIANVFIRYGFGFVFERFSMFRNKDKEIPNLVSTESASPKRLRLAMEELGPTFVKLGQLLSIRPDIMSPEYIAELEKLQDRVPPFSFATLTSICASEGLDLQNNFAYINPDPIAAASIAQVHEATLLSGDKVVLKVQRPEVEKQIETDLEILFFLSLMFEKRSKWGRLYKVSEIVAELGDALRNELDFRKEARNAEIFRRNFADSPNVIVPKIYWEYSSQKVLAMELVEGTKISDFISLKKANYDTRKIVVNFIDTLFKQIYEHGFFHADPHPGNIAIAENEKIIFYDFGQVGLVDPIIREKCTHLLINMMRYDTNGVARALLDIGVGSQRVDYEEFRRDVSRLQRKYYGLPLSEIKVGVALSELIELSVKYQMRLPAELSLMVKMLMTTESIVSQLDPSLSIVDIAEPYGRRVLKSRFSPQRVKVDLQELALDYSSLIHSLPRDLEHILKTIEEGQLKLKLEHSNLKKLLIKIDIISNRLSLAIILASTVISTALIVDRSTSALIARIPLVEIGYATALIFGLFLVYSIMKSGRY
ncbi:MAG: ABC1 kinase family protein [Syntrophomonadaceae bacterium]|jgi:ubiquinone biosynthesis protein